MWRKKKEHRTNIGAARAGCWNDVKDSRRQPISRYHPQLANCGGAKECSMKSLAVSFPSSKRRRGLSVMFVLGQVKHHDSPPRVCLAPDETWEFSGIKVWTDIFALGFMEEMGKMRRSSCWMVL